MVYVLIIDFIIFVVFLKLLFVFIDVVLIVNVRFIFGIGRRYRFVKNKVGEVLLLLILIWVFLIW